MMGCVRRDLRAHLLASVLTICSAIIGQATKLNAIRSCHRWRCQRGQRCVASECASVSQVKLNGSSILGVHILVDDADANNMTGRVLRRPYFH